MEFLVSEVFIKFLSSIHYIMCSTEERQRMMDPNTGSYLYNYSLALNQSETEPYYRDFNYWGYPSDTYAIHFIKTKTFVSVYIQAVIFGLIFCFIFLCSFLVY